MIDTARHTRALRSLTAVLLLSAALPASARAREMLTNGGFEAPFNRGLAHGWEDNSYTKFVVRYSAETENVHSGKSCQKMEVLSFTPGSGVQFCQNVDFDVGKTYTISVWMRAENIEQPVMILLRRGPSPYDHFLYKWVTVTNEWRKFTLTGAPREKDPADNRVYVHFKDVGTLWVDDFSMRQGAFPDETETADVAHLPPGGPNILPNASFEIGLSGWSPIDRILEPGLSIDRTTAAHGAASLRARVNPHRISLDEMERTVASQYLRIGSVAKPYTVSMFLKSDTDGAPVAFGFYSAGRSIRKTVNVTAEWKRYWATGLVGGPESMKGSGHVAITGAHGPVNLWIDAVQVQEGGPAPFAPASPVEVAGYPARADCTFLETEPIEIDLLCAAEREAVDWSFRVEDFWDQEAPATVTFREEEGPPGARRIEVDIGRHGIFRLLATATAHGTSSTAEVVFLRVATPPETSKMGVHGKTYVATGRPVIYGRGKFKAFAPFLPDFCRRIGATWWRLHDASAITDWCLVENKKGDFLWYDGVIDGLRERGFNILGMLVRTPDWAARNPDNNANGRSVPRDYADFENYVTRTAEHYRGRIRHWELWNTPGDPGFWSGTPEEYVKLLEAGSRSLKTVDPDIKVVSVWLGYEREKQEINERLLAAGLTDHLDVFGFHGYGGEAARDNINRFRDVVARHGGMKPLWETEAGAHCATFRKTYFDGADPVGHQWVKRDDYRFTTAAWVRSVATSFAVGSERYFFYWVSPTGRFASQYNAPNLIDYDGTPQPVAAAFSAVTHWLSDASPTQNLALTDRVKALIFQPPEGSLAVIYGTGMPAANTMELTIPLAPETLQYIDLMGNHRALDGENETTFPVSSEPFYLLAPETPPDALARALQQGTLKGAPLPGELLKKLANYRMKSSHPFFRKHRFIDRLPNLPDVEAYRLRSTEGDILILWHGTAQGVVQNLPERTVSIRPPKATLTVRNALGREVTAIRKASMTHIPVSLVPVFVRCKKGSGYFFEKDKKTQ